MHDARCPRSPLPCTAPPSCFCRCLPASRRASVVLRRTSAHDDAVTPLPAACLPLCTASARAYSGGRSFPCGLGGRAAVAILEVGSHGRITRRCSLPCDRCRPLPPKPHASPDWLRHGWCACAPVPPKPDDREEKEETEKEARTGPRIDYHAVVPVRRRDVRQRPVSVSLWQPVPRGGLLCDRSVLCGRAVCRLYAGRGPVSGHAAVREHPERESVCLRHLGGEHRALCRPVTQRISPLLGLHDRCAVRCRVRIPGRGKDGLRRLQFRVPGRQTQPMHDQRMR
jgi:hypothetical protein